MIRIILCILLLFSTCAGASVRQVIGFWTSGGTPSGDTCIGWPNTGCTVSVQPTSQAYLNADRTYVRPSWTATYDGTIDAVWIRIGSSYTDTPDYLAAVVYTSGSPWVRRCYGQYTGSLSANTWIRMPITTGTVTFTTGDELRYGIAVDPQTDFSVAREDSGGGGLYYSVDDIVGAPIYSIGSWTLSADRDMAIMLEVTPD